MKNKGTGKDGFAAVKLDMSKAYDRVEWSLLVKMMRKMGFEERWISIIMLCVSSMTYQFKVNGECTDVITPQRRRPPSRHTFFLFVRRGSRCC
jgi:hypothetical protein